MSRGTELPAVSLFTGAGGLDLGVTAAARERIGFRAWVENDPEVRQTLMTNHANLRGNPAFFSDITDLNPQTLMDAAGIGKGDCFLLVGGPPCQAFSTAGLRQTVTDQRGRMVHSYFEMVRELRPRFFVFENVRGLLSAALKHRPLSERVSPQEIPEDEDSRLGSVMNRLVLPTFKRMGYEVVYGLLNAADYGTAQVRHRAFVLGSRDREFRSGVFRKQTGRPMMPLDLVPPTHHALAPYEPIRPWRTLRDAIGHMSEPEREQTYGYSRERAAVFARIPQGCNWTFVRDNPKQFPKGHLATIMGNGLHSGGGKEGFWRRLHWDKPAPTLTAQPQQLATSLCHPERERPLSIPEYAAIQDFPDDYVFEGSKSGKYRQIGNAVPVRMAAAIGASILAVADRGTRKAKEEHVREAYMALANLQS